MGNLHRKSLKIGSICRKIRADTREEDPRRERGGQLHHKFGRARNRERHNGSGTLHRVRGLPLPGLGNPTISKRRHFIYYSIVPIAKAGFVDGSTRDELLIMEDQIKELLANNQLYEAYVVSERHRPEDFIHLHTLHGFLANLHPSELSRICN